VVDGELLGDMFSSGCVWMVWCALGVVFELFRVQVIMRRVYMGLM
jgi:hypothetical protein